MERRRRIGNQLKMKLHFLGFELPEDKKISESYFKWVASLTMSVENRFAVDELKSAWREESKRIKRFDEELAVQAEKDPVELIYRSMPGVGRVSARVLSNELGDMTRFDNERQLFSSSGLTPSEHTSGDHVRKGHISRQGSPRIRGLLVEVAWRAIETDASLKQFYVKVARKRDGKRAIVAVARKILGRLRYCLKEKTMWKDMTVVAKAA